MNAAILSHQIVSLRIPSNRRIIGIRVLLNFIRWNIHQSGCPKRLLLNVTTYSTKICLANRAYELVRLRNCISIVIRVMYLARAIRLKWISSRVET